MASAQAFQGVSCKNLLKNKIVPDAHSAAQYPLWVDMRDIDRLLVMCLLAVKGSSGAVSVFELTASDDSAGATNKTIIKAFGTTLPTTAGDQVFLELQAEEIKAIGDAAGVKLRYVSAKISTLVAADVAVLSYLVPEAANRFPQDGLTANLIQ